MSLKITTALKCFFFISSGHSPHFAMLVLSGVNGLPGIAREHLKLAIIVDIPIIVVINKTDIASAISIKKTLFQLKEFVTYPRYKKVLLIIINRYIIMCLDFVIPILRVSFLKKGNFHILWL